MDGEPPLSQEGPSLGPGDGCVDLPNDVDRSPDENQNRPEGAQDRLQRGRRLAQQDSVNNNEEEVDTSSTGALGIRPANSNTGTRPANSNTGTRGVPGKHPSAGPANSVSSFPESQGAPASSSPLVALLQELVEHSDHTLLPRCLHQIAETYFLKEDYEWAVHFIQLERLYHEQLLSNLVALQEQWESRWKEESQNESGPVGAPWDHLELDHLESLKRICRTHQRSTLGAGKFAALDKVLKNSLVTGSHTEGGKQNTALPSCNSDGAAESTRLTEQLGMEEVPPPCGTTDREETEENGTSTLGHQREAVDSPPILAAAASAVTGSHYPNDYVCVGGVEKALCVAAVAEPCNDAGPEDQSRDRQTDRSSQPGEEGRSMEPTAPPSEPQAIAHAPPETVQHVEESDSTDAGRTEPGQDRPSEDNAESGQGPLAGCTTSSPEPEGLEQTEKEEPRPGVEEGDEEGEEDPEPVDVEVPEETSGFEGFEVEATQASLDDLAKRIQVEEITPASGLVSILKRRKASAEVPSASRLVPPKQVAKRKVRFREPDQGLDQDEVGGDSWLLLLLLCLATVVMSVGGTALYCILGNAQSSVCTEFTHNMDFYFGQVQRGLDELRHWFSPSS